MTKIQWVKQSGTRLCDLIGGKNLPTTLYPLTCELWKLFIAAVGEDGHQRFFPVGEFTSSDDGSEVPPYHSSHERCKASINTLKYHVSCLLIWKMEMGKYKQRDE